MTIRRVILLSVVALMTGAAELPAGTSTTGSVSGIVYDSTGAVVPGAVLMISGPPLPGTRSTTTTNRGTYTFPLLPVGDGYELEVIGKGFGVSTISDISVRLGNNHWVPVTIYPQTSEQITVTSTPGPIDWRNTSSSTNISAEQFQALPTTRDYQYLTVLAPGVLFEVISSLRAPQGVEYDHPSPTVGGATHLENDYVIEGLSTRDPLTGGSATKITMDFVKEVQVMTGEFSAEYGRSLGGVVNVITKSGSNQFQGSLFTYQQDADWTSGTVRTSNKGVEDYDLGHDKNDWGASLGGPLRRDFAWFFLSYELRNDVAPLEIVNEFHGLDRREAIRKNEHVYSGKLNVALRPSQLFTLSGFGNPSNTRGWLYGGSITEPAVALITRDSGSTNTSLRYEANLSSSWFADAMIGFHRQDLGTTPDTAQGRNAPMQGDFSRFPVFYRGGHPYEGTEEASRDFFSIRSSHLLGSHELRYGGELERNRYDRSTTFAGYWFYGRQESAELGSHDLLQEHLADFSGYGTNEGTAFFVQDRWQMTPNLFLNVGLRWERQELGSARGVEIAEGRAEDGSIVRRQADSIVLDGNWAPRVGVSWDPTGNGRSRVYATAGRFFQAIPVHLNVESISGMHWSDNWYYTPVAHTSENWFNPAGSPVNSDWILLRTDGSRPGPTPVDANLRLQHQNEYSLGGELAIGTSWTAGARLVRRELKDVVEDHHVFDTNGRRVDYVISNIGRGPYAAEFRTPTRNYEAIELMVQRRLTDRWQVISSFVSSRARGDIDGLYNYANPNFGAYPNTSFDIETPRYQENSYGRLRGDRPYQFKVHSSYRFPFGLTLSEGFTYSAGFPVSAFAARQASEFVRQLYLLPRGRAGRTPDYHTLDLHADYQVPLGTQQGITVTIIADAFNVTDQHKPLAVDQEYFWRFGPEWAAWMAPSNRGEDGFPMFDPELPKSEYFGTPTLYQAPRSFQVGLKLLF